MTSEPVVVAPGRRRVYWHTALTLAVLVGAACLARRHWPVLERGAVRLAVADQGWLLVGGTAAAATWFCAALAQQGAVVRRLPQGRLVAAQFAASAANHLLPAGLGAGAVNLRFLMRCGLPAGRAASALAVKGTAAAVVRAVLIVVLVAVCPGVVRLPHLSAGALLALLAAAVCVAGVLAWSRVCPADQAGCEKRPPSGRPSGVWCVQPQGGGGRRRDGGSPARAKPRAGQSATDDNTAGGTPAGGVGARARDAGMIRRTGSRCRRALAAVLSDIRAVHANPPRAAALWGGSLAFTALHALVLIAVTQAVDLSLSPARVALLYLAASSAAALLPTPGGLGSLDAALALALTAAGAPTAAAASAVLGYRLLTVWLPLLPGLVVLGVMVRRKEL